jgi:hypothetical protein
MIRLEAQFGLLDVVSISVGVFAEPMVRLKTGIIGVFADKIC